MTKFIFLLLLLLVFSITNKVVAQQVNGCLINGVLYPISTSGAFGSAYPVCTVGAGWTYISSAGNFTQNWACYFSGGSYGTYQCPIDDYIPLIVLSAAVCGFYLLKRQILMANLFF